MILCLTDYAAVSEIIDAISDVIEGRTVVALSTGSPEEARAAARQAEKRERRARPRSGSGAGGRAPFFPRGPADLTEHAPVLEQLTELRRGQRLGDGDLDRIHALVQQRIGLGRGHEGLTSILDCGLG